MILLNTYTYKGKLKCLRFVYINLLVDVEATQEMYTHSIVGEQTPMQFTSPEWWTLNEAPTNL